MLFAAAKEREQFVNAQPMSNGATQSPQVVIRNNIYESVLELFTNPETANTFPLRIKFDDENAIDGGGVYRDMLSGFWEEAYCHLFDGGCLLTPVFHPQMDMTVFPTLGKIISHGYLFSGFLPLRIALPTLVLLLFGSTVVQEIPDDVYTETFLETVSTVEADLLRDTLELCKTTDAFSPKQNERLTNILSRFGCRQQPTPTSLKYIIIQCAKYEFLVKPSAVVTAISQGIPTLHQPFWKELSLDNFCGIKEALTASPEKVVQAIEEPYFTNMNEERIFNYLIQFVGSLNATDVQKFLRFTTGSSVCIARPMHVVFNNVEGLACRPIGHTCDCTLELSVNYNTYMDFVEELQAVLLSRHVNKWTMDAHWLSWINVYTL